MSLLPRTLNRAFMDINKDIHNRTKGDLDKISSHIMITTPDSFIRNGHPLIREIYSKNPEIFWNIYNTYLIQIKRLSKPLPENTNNIESGIYYSTEGKDLLLISNTKNFNSIDSLLNIAADNLLNIKIENKLWVNSILGEFTDNTKDLFNLKLGSSNINVGNVPHNNLSALKLSRAMRLADTYPSIKKGIKPIYAQLSNINKEYTTYVNEQFTNTVLNLKVDFIITQPQHSTVNKKIAALEQQLIGKELNKLVIEAASFKGSKSFDEYLDYAITNAIFEKPVIFQKVKEQVKTKTKEQRKVSISKSPKTKVLKKMIPYKGKAPINFSPIRVMGLINEVLAKTIKDNMGNSTDPAILLRYQSGRFSESAKLLTLTRTDANTLIGTYTYQRYPYDTFLPGGRLHTAKRDPRLYIEGSIREAAIDLLGKNFPGLSLELT